MSTSIVQIPFHSTSINAVMHEGKPFVSLRHMCESLGIDIESQRKKLNNKAWATAVLITATGSDGKTYPMTMIDRRTMTMWLATIDVNRIKEESRELLINFQNEAADVLDQHFSGAVAQAFDPASLSRLDILRMAMESETRVHQLESKIEADAGKVAYVDEHVDPKDVTLFRTVCRNLQINESDLRKALIYRRWIYVSNTYIMGGYTVKEYAAHHNFQAYFKVCKYHNKKTGSVTNRETLKVTPEGVAAITRFVEKLTKEYGSVRDALPHLEIKYNQRKGIAA
ncbi:phage antirepressor N-terminal domain-containing protein [Glutamicibacter ardleyensis]|uniref:phage antirepressor N-terminal domain-containing protein n=1 Tax=Glutamicibacter ardleyensis TaxID=225894 RepID=UPI003FD14FC6